MTRTLSGIHEIDIYRKQSYHFCSNALLASKDKRFCTVIGYACTLSTMLVLECMDYTTGYEVLPTCYIHVDCSYELSKSCVSMQLRLGLIDKMYAIAVYTDIVGK